MKIGNHTSVRLVNGEFECAACGLQVAEKGRLQDVPCKSGRHVR